MHGLHVIIGMIFLAITLSRIFFDPCIRLNGLTYKNLLDKNLEKILNLKIFILNNFALSSSKNFMYYFFLLNKYHKKLIPLYSLNSKLINMKIFLGSLSYNSSTPSLNTNSFYYNKLLYITKLIKSIIKNIKSVEKGSYSQIIELWFVSLFFMYYKVTINFLKKGLSIEKNLQQLPDNSLKNIEKIITNLYPYLLKIILAYPHTLVLINASLNWIILFNKL
jgi:hypothetical protein